MSSPKKVAIIVSHPIQYYVPVFRALAESQSIAIRVFYTWSQTADNPVFDPGFGTLVKWDVPLLGGYPSQFVRNTASEPGTERFSGLRNPTLISEIEAWHADAVLVYGWCAHSHLQALRHFAGRIPVLFRGDSTLLDQQTWWRNKLRRAFLRWVYSHVDMAIAVGKNSQDYFEWCGISPQRIALAPHSVDNTHFADPTSEHELRAAKWRLELGISPHAVAFLYAGKLQNKKNPELLFDAFSDTDDAHLVYVGGGELEGKLKERAGGRSNIHFIPFQNQSVMPTIYRIGDLFVLPSRGPGETWGLALNEAMASSRPIVASSKVGSARDLIEHGSNGWVFESGATDELTRILADASGRGRAGLKAMGKVAREMTTPWSTEESARLINEAIAVCRRRDSTAET